MVLKGPFPQYLERDARATGQGVILVTKEGEYLLFHERGQGLKMVTRGGAVGRRTHL